MTTASTLKNPAKYHPWKGEGIPAAQLAAVGRVVWMRTPKNMEILVYMPDKTAAANTESLRYFCHGFGLSTYIPNSNDNDNNGYTIMSTHCGVVLKDDQLAQEIVGETRILMGQYTPGFLQIPVEQLQSPIIGTNPKVDRLTESQIFGALFSSKVDVNGNADYCREWNIRSGDVVAWWSATADRRPIERFPRYDQVPPTRPTSFCEHTAIITKPIFEPRKENGQVRWYLSRDTKVQSKNGGLDLDTDTTLGKVMDFYHNSRIIAVYRLLPIPPTPPPPPSAAMLAEAQKTLRDKLAKVDNTVTANRN